MKWLKSLDGWFSGRWRIRGPIMGHAMFWVYRNGNRYTPTGSYEDVVHFVSVHEARRFVEDLEGKSNG